MRRLIRIELDEASLGATRIAISPLWDAFCSMHLALPHRHPSWPYQEWVGQAREVWREDDRTPAAVGPVRRRAGEVSDFLLPRPVGTVHVQEELDPLRATDPGSSASRSPSAIPAWPSIPSSSPI